MKPKRVKRTWLEIRRAMEKTRSKQGTHGRMTMKETIESFEQRYFVPREFDVSLQEARALLKQMGKIHSSIHARHYLKEEIKRDGLTLGLEYLSRKKILFDQGGKILARV